MSLIRWKQKNQEPFKSLINWEDPLDSFSLFSHLDQYLNPFLGSKNPAIDVSEDENNIFIKADLPGVEKQHISVSVNENVLTIKGERKSENEEKKKNYHAFERSYGVFERSLYLGTCVDQSKINAKYKDGVLEMILPKKEGAKARQIDVEG